MHLVVLHGYLLQGTGSNIYVANIARAWQKQGHSVSVLCQDLKAVSLPFVEEFIGPKDKLPYLMKYAHEGLKDAKKVFVGTRYVRDRVLEVFSNGMEGSGLKNKL